MIALSASGSGLTLFHATKLLNATMVVFNRPTPFGVLQAGQLAHLQVIGRPVFPVTVWSDDQKNLHQPKALQMNQRAAFSDTHLANRSIACAIGIDQAVAFQAGQPAPA